MQNEISFIISGKAKPKQSFRYTRGGIKYTPRDVKQYARDVQMAFCKYVENWLPSYFFEKPLKVKIKIYKSIPQSFSKINKQRAIDGELRPLTKPDVDNYTKNILDALNGIAYPDDKQIVELTVSKHYGNTDYVFVKIEAI